MWGRLRCGKCGARLRCGKLLTTLDRLCELRQSERVFRPKDFQPRVGFLAGDLSGYPRVLAQFRWCRQAHRSALHTVMGGSPRDLPPPRRRVSQPAACPDRKSRPPISVRYRTLGIAPNQIMLAYSSKTGSFWSAPPGREGRHRVDSAVQSWSRERPESGAPRDRQRADGANLDLNQCPRSVARQALKNARRDIDPCGTSATCERVSGCTWSSPNEQATRAIWERRLGTAEALEAEASRLEALSKVVV